jgi:hypothetical protein
MFFFMFHSFNGKEPRTAPSVTINRKRALLATLTVVSLCACGESGGQSQSDSVTQQSPTSTSQSPRPTNVQTTKPLAKWGPESWKLMGKVSTAVTELEANTKASKNRTELLVALEGSRLKFEDLTRELGASDLAHASDVAQRFLPDLNNALKELISAATSGEADAATIALTKVDYLMKKWSDISKCTLNKTTNCV